jgi:ATP-dependent Clp protease ATP-binding subunit ClpX
VKLEFTQDALETIADYALKRETGARGLRAVIEEVMLNTMYELPSKTNIARCVITKDVVSKRKEPILIYQKESA